VCVDSSDPVGSGLAAVGSPLRAPRPLTLAAWAPPLGGARERRTNTPHVAESAQIPPHGASDTQKTVTILELAKTRMMPDGTQAPQSKFGQLATEAHTVLLAVLLAAAVAKAVTEAAIPVHVKDVLCVSMILLIRTKN
jgi:hypothetical protein